MSKPYLFSPSEFAFGYSGCKRCYYDLKVNDIRINFGFPTIFSKIDSIQKKFYHNKPSKYLNTNKVPNYDCCCCCILLRGEYEYPGTTVL